MQYTQPKGKTHIISEREKEKMLGLHNLVVIRSCTAPLIALVG